MISTSCGFFGCRMSTHRLVYSRHTVRQHRKATHVPRRQSCGFARRSFSVIVSRHDSPFYSVIAIVRGDLGHILPGSRQLVEDRVGLAIVRVDGADEQILLLSRDVSLNVGSLRKIAKWTHRDVFEVTSVSVPRPRW